MKTYLVLASLLAATNAIAAPFLYADPYPTAAVVPDSATLTINGGAPLACELVAVAGGTQPKCDLASITTSGTYTLVMQVCKAASITNSPNAAAVTVQGCAVSVPFALRWVSDPVVGPTLNVGP